jgi:hypothetical protein
MSPTWTPQDLVNFAKRQKIPMKSGYNPKIVLAYFEGCGLPTPEMEYKFHPKRKWRFDFAWFTNATNGVALEVQGGIFSQGRHNRGAAMLKEWEKLNEAAALGWRVIYCQPQDLCTLTTATLIQRCLKATL